MLLDRMIQQQAQIVAYMDDYKMPILTTFPTIGPLLPMRQTRHGAAAPR
jgi:hypothetical protein